MRCKRISIVFCALFLVCQTADSQNISRWLSFPRESQPGIIKDPLAQGHRGKSHLKFQYETEPVTPLMRLLIKSFPEAFAPEALATESYNIGRSTIILEELKDEADEILQQSPDAASSSTNLSESQIR